MELPQNWLIATDGSKYATMSVRYAAKLYKFQDHLHCVITVIK